MRTLAQTSIVSYRQYRWNVELKFCDIDDRNNIDIVIVMMKVLTNDLFMVVIHVIDAESLLSWAFDTVLQTVSTTIFVWDAS